MSLGEDSVGVDESAPINGDVASCVAEEAMQGVSLERFHLWTKKVGMTTLFDASGEMVGCTLLEVPKHVVSGIKDSDTDGYSAVQLGVVADGAKRSFRPKNKANSRPVRISLEKRGVPPCFSLFENRVDPVAMEAFKLSNSLMASTVFEAGVLIDAIAETKGKGFQGVMKRHGMAGGPASHGASRFHRRGGSVGGRSTPGRTFKNRPQSGRMGGERVTVKRLLVCRVLSCEDLGLSPELWRGVEWLVVRGAIPGATGADVFVCRSCIKKK